MKPDYEQLIRMVLSDADRLNQSLNDPNGDGTGDGAQPPTGDSYNELWDILERLRIGVEEEVEF